jgi:hypothetical protein
LVPAFVFLDFVDLAIGAAVDVSRPVGRANVGGFHEAGDAVWERGQDDVNIRRGELLVVEGSIARAARDGPPALSGDDAPQDGDVGIG